MAVDGSKDTYLNPVYGRSFPDPFVLKHCGVYYAYSTGHAPDGNVFEVIASQDLVDWTSVGGAMQPLETGEPFYWAPEVTYHQGKFYLYYSVGNETLMTLRVAVSDRPDGGFADSGVKLTTQDFAIDAHVFCDDDDGSWWMFYATDFLEHEFIGTGTVVDRMIDMFTLAGDPRPVTRARYPWQVYDPERKEKGGVRWHTVEGPFILKRKGTYYEMFSGGNWQNISYGVSFAVSETLQSDDEWQQYSDDEKTFPLIRTIPEKVIGPGHNSVIRGPNGRELYCVYHRWVDDNRVMAIDRMDFAGGERMFICGPTYTPTPCPYKAQVHETPVESTSFNCPGSCLLELTFTGNAEVQLLGGDNVVGTVSLPNTDFVQELQLDVDGIVIDARLNGLPFEITQAFTEPIEKLRLAGDAAFHSLSITCGFEDLFDRDDLTARGWYACKTVGREVDHLYIEDALIQRQLQDGDSELAVNISYDSQASIVFGTEFVLMSNSIEASGKAFDLPANFPSEVFHQFRFVKRGDAITVFVDEELIGVVMNDEPTNQLSISSLGVARLDMVRHTLI